MKTRSFALTAWATVGALALVAGFGHSVGLRINTTVSAPRGLWRLSQISPASLKTGEMVSVCPPAVPVVLAMLKDGYIGPGACRGTNSEPFLKPVVAVAGDTVTVQPGGPVEVNGKTLPNSAPLSHMPVWPAGTYKVKPGEVWLISSYDPGSFDSRYFGPVPVANVRGQAVPVLIRGNPEAVTLHPLLHVAEAGGVK